MLNGVGGATIDEAKQRMTYAEFQSWVQFKKMRGSLFTGNRLESGFALLAWMYQKAHGGKSDLVDFMPHAERDQADIMKVMSILNGARANGQ